MLARYQASATVIGLIPDIALAWLFKWLTDGGSFEFWVTLGLIWGVQTAFWLKREFAVWLFYRLKGKSTIADVLARELDEQGFPTSGESRAFLYLSDVTEDETLSMQTRLAAARYLGTLDAMLSAGVLASIRGQEVFDLAIERQRSFSQLRGSAR